MQGKPSNYLKNITSFICRQNLVTLIHISINVLQKAKPSKSHTKRREYLASLPIISGKPSMSAIRMITFYFYLHPVTL